MAFLDDSALLPAIERSFEITGIQGDVSVDGETVTLYAETPSGTLPLSVGLASLSALVASLVQLGNAMLIKQVNRRESFEQILAEAPTVRAAAITIDDKSGDVAILFRPTGLLPLALRFPVEMVMSIRQDIDAEIGGKSH